MPILKLVIFTNSKSQKFKLWDHPPPPLLEKVYNLNYFFGWLPEISYTARSKDRVSSTTKMKGSYLHRPDVGVRPEEDVLQLGLLLVDPLHGETLVPHGGLLAPWNR